MKTSFYLAAIAVIFACCFSVGAQEFNLTEFIDKTRATSRRTAYQNYFEFTYDFNRTRESKDEKRTSENFESVCSKKRCEYILTAKNGKFLSEKSIEKNRKRAAKRLEKAESLPENKSFADGEIVGGYGFAILTRFSQSNSHFNPSLYLKNCRVKFVERISLENRSTVKLRAADCSVESEERKISLQFMTETEASIWVDEQDKAVVRMEVFGKTKIQNAPAPPIKPVVVMRAERVAEGFWFWKLIKTDPSASENFFPKDYGEWQVELYNYKPYTVLIDKVEIDKK